MDVTRKLNSSTGICCAQRLCFSSFATRQSRRRHYVFGLSVRPFVRSLAVAKYCDVSVCVCLSVCLSVREDIPGTTRAIFTKFLWMLPMAVARSCSGVIAIRYVLPVLWMSSCLFSIMGRIAVWSSLLWTDYLPQRRTEFNIILLKGIRLTNYFEITRKNKRRTEKFDD